MTTRKIRGAKTDKELRYVTQLAPEMEQWRKLAAEWVSQRKRNQNTAMQALRHFLVVYILEQKLETTPEKFLRRGYVAPDFVTTALKNLKSKHETGKQYRLASEFVDYVLHTYYTIDGDDGRSFISPAYCNPIPPLDDSDLARRKGLGDESNKSVLPYQYITVLRGVICPKGARHFSDWHWAQEAGNVYLGGDWFAVSPDLINETDPDCIWRERETSEYERKKYGHGNTVVEIWSPACAVALFIKLHLPLRTYQVRMLDSGEADTKRYENGKWVKNTGRFAMGSAKNPYRRGVFRQMTDDVHRTSMTGLFINTNKTADKGKDEWTRGYVIPWEHTEVLYWLEKLRNWQEKYNPIARPTLWTDLDLKHLGSMKHSDVLARMGETTFLFRDAAGSGDDRHKPLGDRRPDLLWSKLLKHLEDMCATNGERDLAGNPLRFHTGRSTTTFYPLHSLRVSLITAYALEGGVPMQILSKCIAGHSRLIMTLYYTKAGITYCTDVMEEATKRLLENEQESMIHWMRDKTYDQLEANGVYYDPAAIQAVVQAMQSGGAPLVRDDKGLCSKSGWACDSGGVYVNEDTSKITYGEVPGYPQKNCVRCRWFFTGPAFIDGLQNHWNNIQLQMADVGERIVRLEGEIEELENEQYECQENDRPFLDRGELDTLRKVHQCEIEKNNKHAEDSQATYRLIARCRVLMEDSAQVDGVRLVAVGALPEVQIAIEECTKMQQILSVIAGSSVYPEHDVSKAVLQAGKAFDMMLKRNGKEPVFFSLDDSEQQRVTQHMTRLLAATTGSIKNAVPFVEGVRRLSEIGLDINMNELAQAMATSPALSVDSFKLVSLSEHSRTGVARIAHEIDQEVGDAAE